MDKEGKSIDNRVSKEDIDFLEEEALRGKPVCLCGDIQRIKRTCNFLREYLPKLNSIRNYEKS